MTCPDGTLLLRGVIIRFNRLTRTDSAMATDKKNDSHAGRRALLAIVVLVVIALDIWWVANGQERDIFPRSPPPKPSPRTRCMSSYAAPSLVIWSGALPCDRRFITFRKELSSPAFGRFRATKAPHGSPGIASPMSSHNGWLRRKIQLGV